jgi:hypothetical protein
MSACDTLMAFIAESPNVFAVLGAYLNSLPEDASPELREHAGKVLQAINAVKLDPQTAFEFNAIDDAFFEDTVEADYGFVQLMGPNGPYRHDSVRCGLSFQAPGLSYKGHHHVAQELYFVLRGSSLWWTDSAPAWEERECSFHHPNEHHAMRTADAPALYFWSWTGDTTMEIKHSPSDHLQAKL